MAVVYNGRGSKGSAWDDSNRKDGEAAEDANLRVEAAIRLYPMEVSLREQQLLLRLRMLEAGEYQVVVIKEARGMVGLKEWTVDSEQWKASSGQLSASGEV